MGLGPLRTAATALLVALAPCAHAACERVSRFSDQDCVAADRVHTTASEAHARPAPLKGGAITLGAVGSFDNVNPFAIGGLATGATQYTLDELATAEDDAGSRRCLVCASATIRPQTGVVEFAVRTGTRFHDGSPVAADDVAWTIRTLRDEAHPFFRSILRDVRDVEARAPGRVIVRTRPGAEIDVAMAIASLPVQSRRWWSGRDIARPSLEPPLGSGPYRIVAVEPHRRVVLERVVDYWGRDLPANRDRHNFDAVRIEYFRDHAIAREAFLAGEFDVRIEPDPRAWPGGYAVAAVESGRVRLLEVPEDRVSGMTGFVFNLRHPVLSDLRVREALAATFDFDWINRAFFSGRLTRAASFFNNGELGARGLPEGVERELLAAHATRLPPGVFDEPWTRRPAFGADRRARKAFAVRRLLEAGLRIRDTRMTLADGSGAEFEILLGDAEHERIALAYADDLRRIGIETRVRTVDPAQFQRRLTRFDYDITFTTLGQSEMPGGEQRMFWTAAAAATAGSENIAGVQDAVVDALVERIVAASDRPSLVAATRALDRVLLSSFLSVPFGHTKFDRVAYWDRFGMPERHPRSGVDVMTWWIDPAKNGRSVLSARR